MDNHSSRKKKGDDYRAGLELTALAFMFPIAIALGFGWGWAMDRVFGTSPWLTAIFTGFGVIAAFLNLFRMVGKGGGFTDPPDDPKTDV